MEQTKVLAPQARASFRCRGLGALCASFAFFPACVGGAEKTSAPGPEVVTTGDEENSHEGNSEDPGTGDGDVLSPPGAVNDALLPQDGQSWLFIGQDMLSIVNYAEEVGTPPGIVGYTSLQQLEGLMTLADNGGGPNHMHGIAARYPKARIALGLYLVDYLETILSGGADAKIAELAQVLALYKRPVLLRVGYEFDAEWTHYHPPDYVDAYRRIVDGIRDAGTDNVAYVWQSAAMCAGRFGSFALDAWYPGDDYVDWIGLSYFTQIECDYGPVKEVTELARKKGKPVIVAEAAPQWYDLGELSFSVDGVQHATRSGEQIWNDWFQPFFQYVRDNSDVVRAVTYINADWDSQDQWDPPYENGYWGDSRVQASNTILTKWETALTEHGWSPSP